MSDSLIKQPSALLPIILSLAALALLLGYVAMFGVVHHLDVSHDERAPARIFQILIGIQIPIAGYFALKWLPRAPGQTLLILALQVCTALMPIFLVIWLERQ